MSVKKYENSVSLGFQKKIREKHKNSHSLNVICTKTAIHLMLFVHFHFSIECK